MNLNANWQPVGFKTVKDAITDLCGSESSGNPSCLALDIDYELDNDGNPIFSKQTLININPVSWDVWCWGFGDGLNVSRVKISKLPE